MPEKSRLQKILASSGVASRRKAEELIAAGRVTVNGRVARLGDSAVPGKDTIALDGKPLGKSEKKIYLALHKPRGFVTTLHDERGRKCVAQLVEDVGERVYPVGRLDKDSEGLILMTNNGEIVNKIMRAGNRHEKEYIVTVNREVTGSFLHGMANGVPLTELGVTTRKCKVEKLGKHQFKIILTQGLNRQIRRMCEYFEYRVTHLKRVRIMNIRLGDLENGTYRKITEEEWKTLQRLIRDSSSETVKEKSKGRTTG